MSALASAAMVLASGIAQAINYPDRIIRLINPFSSGGTTDILARILAERLSTELGRRVIVDIKDGGGNIGLEFAARSPADGYTLAMYPVSSVMAPSAYKNLEYDPIKDLSAVALVGTVPALLVVHPGRSINSVAELIAYAKANPGELRYASAGIGSSPHLYMELFKHQAGVDILHVPYTGQGPSIFDQIAGQVDLSFQTATAILPHVRSNQVRAIATSAMEPFKPLPEVPSISKTVPGFDASTWFGIVAPAGVPKAIIDKLNSAIMKVLAHPAVMTTWDELGVTVAPNNAEQFSAFIRSEHEQWAKVAERAGVKRD